MHNFRELKIWQRSRELVKKVYLASTSLPAGETYGLTSQIRRAAVSIAANIAEGSGRNSKREMIRYLDISNGSAFELETLLILANDMEYMTSAQSSPIICELNEIEKMIFSLKKKLLLTEK